MTSYAMLPASLINTILREVIGGRYTEDLKKFRFFPVLIESESEKTPPNTMHHKSILWLKFQESMVPTFLYTKVVVSHFPFIHSTGFYEIKIVETYDSNTKDYTTDPEQINKVFENRLCSSIFQSTGLKYFNECKTESCGELFNSELIFSLKETKSKQRVTRQNIKESFKEIIELLQTRFI